MLMRRRYAAAALIIAALIGIGFALSVPHTRDVPRPAQAPAAPAASTTTVTLRDTYKKGVHTLDGSVLAPDACAVVGAEASLAGDASSTESIALSLSMPADTGVCLELPTPVPFSTTVAAPAGIPITASLNGAGVQIIRS